MSDLIATGYFLVGFFLAGFFLSKWFLTWRRKPKIDRSVYEGCPGCSGRGEPHLLNCSWRNTMCALYVGCECYCPGCGSVDCQGPVLDVEAQS